MLLLLYWLTKDVIRVLAVIIMAGIVLILLDALWLFIVGMIIGGLAKYIRSR